MEQFDEIIDKIFLLWAEQKEKAGEADKLMERCEEIEVELHKLLDLAAEMYPEGYQEFLSSFNPTKGDN